MYHAVFLMLYWFHAALDWLPCVSKSFHPAAVRFFETKPSPGLADTFPLRPVQSGWNTVSRVLSIFGSARTKFFEG